MVGTVFKACYGFEGDGKEPGRGQLPLFDNKLRSADTNAHLEITNTAQTHSGVARIRGARSDVGLEILN